MKKWFLRCKTCKAKYRQQFKSFNMVRNQEKVKVNRNQKSHDLILDLGPGHAQSHRQVQVFLNEMHIHRIEGIRYNFEQMLEAIS